MPLAIYEYPMFHGVGPRGEQAGVGLLKGWVDPAPVEDVKHKAGQ